jgi:hypothetical protein
MKTAPVQYRARHVFSLSFVPLVLALSPQTPQQVKEPESGHKYDVMQVALGAETSLALTGVGIREKTIFAVNVYSFGLYIEPTKARELFAEWKDKKAKELHKDTKFYTALLDDSLLKELRIKFCRDVLAEDVRSAFEDSLEPRILQFTLMLHNLQKRDWKPSTASQRRSTALTSHAFHTTVLFS